MADFVFKHSSHADHGNSADGLTWVRNGTANNLVVTDAGNNLPMKTCGGMSSPDATTRALIADGTLTICSAPATPKEKPRPLRREAEKPNADKAEEPSEG
jgi:hypothetical protein